MSEQTGTTPAATDWQPIERLGERFANNLAALAQRNEPLVTRLKSIDTESWHVRADANGITLGRPEPSQGVEQSQIIACPAAMTPAAANRAAATLYPTGHCNTGIVIAGLDHGWLWTALHRLKPAVAEIPGHQPPLFFLASDIQRFRAVLHLHDWRRLLADSRVHVFAGPDATDQLASTLTADPWLARPSLSVTIEPNIWPMGKSFEQLMQDCSTVMDARLDAAIAQIETAESSLTPEQIIWRLTNANSLRVIGVTSRYAGSSQQSMRDWLDAMQSLGHETHLIIERNVHEVANRLVLAESVAEFRPDLVLLIDNYRTELGGLGQTIPCVIWMRNRAPTAPACEDDQPLGDHDYLLGVPRHECVTNFGLPRDRLIPCGPVIHEPRFERLDIADHDQSRFRCDLAMVIDGGPTPAELLASAMQSQESPLTRRLMETIFAKLHSIYSANRSISEPPLIRRLIEQALLELELTTNNADALVDLFSARINDAFYRQQVLTWAAASGLDLRIYGHTWHGHPALGRYARPAPASDAELLAIYRNSTICLFASPLNSADQPLLDALSAGAFPLIRETTGDRVDRLRKAMHTWAKTTGARSAAEFFGRATPKIKALADEIALLRGLHPATDMDRFWSDLADRADDGWRANASTLFPEFDRIAFASNDELSAKIEYYLAHPTERTSLAIAMRQRIIQTASDTQISQRALRFIAAHMSRQQQPSAMLHG
jgi:hypothetical protein